MRIYVASSWHNGVQPDVVRGLRVAGFSVYDFRNPTDGNTGFAWTDIDPEWRSWTAEQMVEGLSDPVAQDGFWLDFGAMRGCDACVLLLPCGRSAHLEAGYFIGAGKPVHILLHGGDPELMYLMTTKLHTDIGSVIEALRMEPALALQQEPQSPCSPDPTP